MTVWELKRNDIEAAKRLIIERGDALTSDEARVLSQLQDDPTELEEWALARQSATA